MAVVEQIYIDGQLFELADDGGIELVFQSPLFTDLDSIVSNRTNEVRFPLTPHNRRAMRLAGLVSPESSELYEYRKHTASYWRDGVHLFDGSATLLSWSATDVSFVLTWGNTEAFQKLFDTQLQALQSDTRIDERYVPFGDTGQREELGIRYYPANLSFGVRALAVPHTHPSLQVNAIMTAIGEYVGVSGLSDILWGDMIVPLLTKNTDREANIVQAPHLTEGNVHRVIDLMAATNRFWLALGANDTDYINMASNGWIFDVSQYNSLTLQINDYVARLTTNDAYISAAYSGNIVVFATDADGNNGVQIAEIATIANSWTNDTQYGQLFRVSGVEQTLDVSEYAYITIRVAISTTRVSIEDTLTFDTIDMHIVPDIDEAQEVVYTGDRAVLNYPLFTNLPDWSMGQFVKNLMKIKGLFANVKSSTEIEFVSVSDVYDNRAQAYDWTARLLGAVSEISPTFGDYAQKNTLQYAEDDTVKGNYNGTLIVDNTTLDNENELLSVDFAGTDKEVVNGNVIYTIPIYSYGGEGGDAIEYNGGLTPRILNAKPSAGTPSMLEVYFNLSFEELVATVYADYQSTILRPRVLTVDIYIEPRELATLDLAVPCYFEQLRHYYAIMSLTTKEGNRATATLLQLADK